MSGTALDHRLVRGYLADLDAAMRGLPAAQARDLREQISAHLEDVLPPEATDEQVAEALAYLGSPAFLAAEARGVVPAPGPARATSAFRALLVSIRPRTWIIACLIVIAAAAAGRVCDHYLSAGSMTYTLAGGWWYSQDAAHQQIVVTNTATQNTTPIRSGQRQGYIVSILNPTNVTQTIVGDASGTSGWNSPGSGSVQITVSTSYSDIANGFAGEVVARHLKFSALPVSIPPLQTRIVRVLWTSDLCLSANETNGINVLYLRVRVGWFTRTESIPMQEWALAGPSHGRCTG